MDHSDRCDKCGAQAFMLMTLKSGDLMFCAHHGREYRPLMEKDALLITDESEFINKKPSVAAF